LPLSLFLPTCTAGFILIVGFAVLTRHDEIRLDEDLRVVKRVVGLALRTRRAALGQLEGVHLISPDAAKARHVLILTEAGPLAFPYTGENALPLIDALRELAEPRISGDHPARASGDQ
jgi:hypothetical protein